MGRPRQREPPEDEMESAAEKSERSPGERTCRRRK
jgi:hypothetical protein